MWRSFEEIGAETAEKVCLEKIKNSTQNITVVPLSHRGVTTFTDYWTVYYGRPLRGHDDHNKQSSNL